jgi:hypothetical protein
VLENFVLFAITVMISGALEKSLESSSRLSEYDLLVVHPILNAALGFPWIFLEGIPTFSGSREMVVSLQLKGTASRHQMMQNLVDTHIDAAGIAKYSFFEFSNASDDVSLLPFARTLDSLS